MSSPPKKKRINKEAIISPALESEELDNEYEDPFGDEFEEEEYEEEGELLDEEGDLIDGKITEKQDDDNDNNIGIKRVFRPGIDKIAEGEELIYDPSAYVMYHSLRTEWPCLSFDVIPDNLGENRQRFPHSMYMIAGSQADKESNNKMTILKLSDLAKTQIKSSDDSDDDDDDDDDDGEDDAVDVEPCLEHINIAHKGGINRVRCMPSFKNNNINISNSDKTGVIASMADTGKVYVYDLRNLLDLMMSKQVYGKSQINNANKPITTFDAHNTEGYAIDWSPTNMGQIATGDCDANIWVWDALNNNSGVGLTNQGSCFLGHTNSVEDIQWSPSESTVFASASSDRTVKIWDTRATNGKSQLSVDAHFDDVNVISWNRKVEYLLASGCDDGSFKVWDLRTFKSGQPLANFSYHKQAITSIQWAPHDESVLCVSGEDNQVTIWDLSVEADVEEERNAMDQVMMNDNNNDGNYNESIYPPQLLFIHMGQTNVKEIQWHPQIPGAIVTTAEDGFNIFKPAINVMN